ncbi:MAG TPA: LysR family transcriptional regulator [Chthoniobacteraceae bacterium]|nr:LysR family transcriptional regulator [Chthoniobacteraceae bacterium]
MNVETFKIFCDLADTSSFSKAAKINSITQSAVSQQIRSLESRYKVTLVERGRRNFSLTPEGQAFLQAGREILHIYDHLSDRLHELQNIVAGDVKVSSVYSIGLHEFPPYLKEFRRLYPDVNVHVEYGRTTQVYTQVLNGEADLGLVAYPTRRKGLLVEKFLEDRMVAICHPNHPLAKKKSVQLEELAGEKFISFGPDLSTRKVIERHLKGRGISIEFIMEFDNIETVKRAVEIENGISIVPEHTIQAEVQAGILASVEINKPEIWRPLGILLKRSRPRSPAQREFINLLQKDLDGKTPASA